MSDVVRWAAFSCVLVPTVLLWYGSSLAGAAGTALGLAAVTGACVILLRQSERGAALLADEQRSTSRPRGRAPRQRGRHGRTGKGSTGATGSTGHGSGAGPRAAPRGGSGTGVHRGARHTGGNESVD
ncbi:hypothetical protein OG485_17340 [Streptomyces sp. NBC_00328]|nr:hypothetical protein [Streptomyces sp. NBC_00328]